MFLPLSTGGQGVGGSNPLAPTKVKSINYLKRQGHTCDGVPSLFYAGFTRFALDFDFDIKCSKS